METFLVTKPNMHKYHVFLFSEMQYIHIQSHIHTNNDSYEYMHITSIIHKYNIHIKYGI
jgi:hypothetical protein